MSKQTLIDAIIQDYNTNEVFKEKLLEMFERNLRLKAYNRNILDFDDYFILLTAVLKKNYTEIDKLDINKILYNITDDDLIAIRTELDSTTVMVKGGFKKK